MIGGIEFIHDPAFYAAAVPAAALVGMSKSGFASGMGALAVPLVALSVTVPQAAAIVLPLLAVADLMGLIALRKHADWGVLRQLLPAGLLGIVVGWLSFGLLPSHVVAGITGVVTLLFLAFQIRKPVDANSRPPGRLATASLALTSGYTSFVAHSGAPPIVVALLPRRMAPLVYSGTTAVFFAAINASKWLPYSLLGLFDSRNLATSVALFPVAGLGVLVGVWATQRISSRGFYLLVQAGMLVTGVKLVADAFMAH
ncbi:MAG: sulfite exporter TauE/SafE family protein [Leptothrix sp. (in: b-proteobacteria)]